VRGWNDELRLPSGMRILVQSLHIYPANKGGPGGGRVFDVLVKGLAELGHEVIYYLEHDPLAPLPSGVIHTNRPRWDADIFHIRSDSSLSDELIRRRLPWVATCHTDPAVWGRPRDVARDNWIYVSRNLSSTLNSERHVLNGIDPSEFIYSEEKDQYLLFVSTLRLASKKGLAEAIAIAQASHRKLLVAGSDPDPELVGQVRRQTERAGMTYLGEISGPQKAMLFAKASAILFPTQINEAFGLVMAEALMSGTPVICSAEGACPELITPDVGFVCTSREDYLQAVQRVNEISPKKCRFRAMQEFHYLKMARGYYNEYQKELRVFKGA